MKSLSIRSIFGNQYGGILNGGTITCNVHVGIGFYFLISVTMRTFGSATGEALEAVKNNSEKVGQLIGEIAAASGEQAQGT